jgi:hypothetical protein
MNTMTTTTPPLRPAELSRLKGLVERFEHPGHREARPTLSTGVAAVDRLLPHRGLRGGMLVEWVADGPGSGASLLPTVALKNLQRRGGAIVVVDRRGNFYPPAASAWGIDLAQTIVLRPTSEADELWAIDQTLRCGDVAAVLAWPQEIDGFTFRRWQLAAEASGAIGLFVRPASAEREPTWATARLLVSPRQAIEMDEDELPSSWKLCVTVLRSRGGRAHQSVELEVDEQTGNIHEAAPHESTHPRPTHYQALDGQAIHKHQAGDRRLAASLAHRTHHEQTA